MAKLTTILQERFLKKKENPKMADMARQSSDGTLTPFAGLFQVGKLSEHEAAEIESILKTHTPDDMVVEGDLDDLLAITGEVRAINNQAIILHGERIRRAQQILKRYHDGAFTAWLIATYGNRQTPYNFLQYYDFHLQMPKALQSKLEEMPRQAVYTLASRNGEQADKEKFVKSYKGETKQQLLEKIREEFPLAETDRRREDVGEGVIKTLHRLARKMQEAEITTEQKKELMKQLQTLKGLLK